MNHERKRVRDPSHVCIVRTTQLLSPVRLRGLRGSLAGAHGEGGSATGRLGERGLIPAGAAGPTGDGGVSSVLERVEVLHDFLRGNCRVG